MTVIDIRIRTAAFALAMALFLVRPAALSSAASAIPIAAIYSLTGQASNANSSSLLGVRLAVSEINDRGGLIDRPLSLMVLDNMSTPIGASLAARQAADYGVSAIIGCAWSNHSLAVAEVAAARGIPMISNYSTYPQLTRIGDCIFRVCFTDDFQGRIIADFARQDLKAEKALVFVDLTSDYSLYLSRVFQEYFSKSGGRVLGEIEYKLNQNDYNAQVAAAGRYEPDVILLSGHDESGVIAQAVQSSGIRAIPLGGDGWGDPSFLDMGGKTLKRGYYCSHWSPESESPASRRFMERYGADYPLGAGTALAYDAVTLLASAIDSAGSTRPDGICAALRATRSFAGVTGNLRMDDAGNPIKSAVIMEIRNGKPHYYKTLEPH